MKMTIDRLHDCLNFRPHVGASCVDITGVTACHRNASSSAPLLITWSVRTAFVSTDGNFANNIAESLGAPTHAFDLRTRRI
jgi:hypothetical protein